MFAVYNTGNVRRVSQNEELIIKFKIHKLYSSFYCTFAAFYFKFYYIHDNFQILKKFTYCSHWLFSNISSIYMFLITFLRFQDMNEPSSFVNGTTSNVCRNDTLNYPPYFPGTLLLQCL